MLVNAIIFCLQIYYNKLKSNCPFQTRQLFESSYIFEQQRAQSPTCQQFSQYMQQQSTPEPSPLEYLHPISTLYRNITTSHSHPHRLIKILKHKHQLYAGYQDGYMAIFDLNQHRLSRTTPIYKNTPVIDFCLFDKKLASCTHSEVTVHDTQTNKFVSLKGHESTPLFVTVHPICPLILSCSNLLLLHDLRILKPINVQFITPPAFGLEYFPDGQFFLLSGEPIRIGNTRWVRTLMNGMSRVSRNGKHVVSSDMNGKICLWDWRDSTQLLTIEKVRNYEVYQPVYFGVRAGWTRQILFLEENSEVMRYDIMDGEADRFRLSEKENCKMYVEDAAEDTEEVFRFGHDGVIERYALPGNRRQG